jgi:predicted phage-related endonuclease
MEVKRRQITSVQDWLMWRRDYLCASEIAGALGLDAYVSPLGTYAQKAGMVTVVETPLMKRGRFFESAALAYFSDIHPEYYVTRPNVFLMNDEHRIACTPDAILEPRDGPRGEIVNLQLKTIAKPIFEKWEGVPPIGYTLQVATENMLTDATRGILGVLAVGTFDAEMHVFDIPRHEGAERNILKAADDFWMNMEAARFPSPDFKRDADLIAAMHPRGEPGLSVDLSADNRLAELLPKRAELMAQADSTKAELEAINAEIKAKMGNAEMATFPGWFITYKEQTRRAYTVAESSARVLRVKEQSQ